MKRAALVVIVLFTACLAARPVLAQTTIDPAFRADIEKLLDESGAARMGPQMASMVSAQILDGMKKARPDIPERAIVLAKEVLDTEFATAFTAPDGLRSRLVMVYAKHVTPEDVRGLLAFYESAIGKKMVSLQPVLFQDGAAAGQDWVKENLPHIQQALQSRLRAEGFIK